MAATRRLRGRLRPVEARNLHVTLCFLGERPDADAGRVGEAIERAAAGGADGPLGVGAPEAGTPPGAPGRAAEGGTIGPLEATEPLWLPPRRPGVLTVGLAGPGEPAARALRARLAADLRELGLLSEDDREWLPHVTVARVRRGARVRPSPLALPALPAFAPPAVTLFASRPAGSGPRYDALFRLPLGG